MREGIGARVPKHELEAAPRIVTSGMLEEQPEEPKNQEQDETTNSMERVHVVTAEILQGKTETELRAMARQKVEQAIHDAVAMGLTLDDKKQVNVADRITGYYKTLLEQVRDGYMQGSDLDLAILQKITEIVSSFGTPKNMYGPAVDLGAKRDTYINDLVRGKRSNAPNNSQKAA